MKRLLSNTMTTTGIALVLLAGIGTLSNARLLLISSIFQTLGVNVIIHLGLLITRRFESPYLMLETAVDAAYTVCVLVGANVLFHWFADTPLWLLALMAVLVYLAGLFLRMVRMREDVAAINKLLRMRKQQSQGE